MGSEVAMRSVRITTHRRRVTVEEPGGECLSLSYPGVLLTGYEDGRKAYEKWVPFGADASESDDEKLIEALQEALRWQNGTAGTETPGR
jgi:hypothetical protein